MALSSDFDQKSKQIMEISMALLLRAAFSSLLLRLQIPASLDALNSNFQLPSMWTSISQALFACPLSPRCGLETLQAVGWATIKLMIFVSLLAEVTVLCDL